MNLRIASRIIPITYPTPRDLGQHVDTDLSGTNFRLPLPWRERVGERGQRKLMRAFHPLSRSLLRFKCSLVPSRERGTVQITSITHSILRGRGQYFDSDLNDTSNPLSPRGRGRSANLRALIHSNTLHLRLMVIV
jgi:hypothetical protein